MVGQFIHEVDYSVPSPRSATHFRPRTKLLDGEIDDIASDMSNDENIDNEQLRHELEHAPIMSFVYKTLPTLEQTILTAEGRLSTAYFANQQVEHTLQAHWSVFQFAVTHEHEQFQRLAVQKIIMTLHRADVTNPLVRGVLAKMVVVLKDIMKPGQRYTEQMKRLSKALLHYVSLNHASFDADKNVSDKFRFVVRKDYCERQIALLKREKALLQQEVRIKNAVAKRETVVEGKQKRWMEFDVPSSEDEEDDDVPIIRKSEFERKRRAVSGKRKDQKFVKKQSLFSKTKSRHSAADEREIPWC